MPDQAPNGQRRASDIGRRARRLSKSGVGQRCEKEDPGAAVEGSLLVRWQRHGLADRGRLPNFSTSMSLEMLFKYTSTRVDLQYGHVYLAGRQRLATLPRFSGEAMDQVNRNDIGAHVGESVTLKGWLYNRRSSGSIHFLLVRDGTGTIQCVVRKDEVDDATFQACETLSQESSVMVTGAVREDERSPGGYELTVGENGLAVVQIADEYPITPKEHGAAFLLDNRHLWIRSRRQWAVLRIRARVIKSIRDWLDSNGFLLVDTPIFTPAAVEGTTTLFPVEYFGDTVYLTQSGQLYNEANIMSFGKVYCFGPTFRAEKSKTRRHLTEFWMVEPEMAYHDLEANLEVIEGLTMAIVAGALEHNRDELEILERDVSKLEAVTVPFPRLHYDEATRILQEAGHEFEWGSDFGSPDETELAKRYDSPFFVTHFPSAIKAFYMKRDPERPEITLSCDLLAPEGYGEIVGGSEREDDLTELEKRIAEHELPVEAFEWYLDLRKFGTVPHSGFGLGVERTVTWICGIEHLRETIPFPRMLHRVRP
jgi:asparaginyl-tRNA synthetase